MRQTHSESGEGVVENAVDRVVIELRRGEASESEEAFVSDGDAWWL